jgi:hypothetical protein
MAGRACQWGPLSSGGSGRALSSMPGSLVGLLVAVTLVFGGRHGFLVYMRQGLELGAPWPSWLERHVAVPRDQVTYAAKEPAHA